jgi:hypothetical protein
MKKLLLTVVFVAFTAGIASAQSACVGNDSRACTDARNAFAEHHGGMFPGQLYGRYPNQYLQAYSGRYLPAYPGQFVQGYPTQYFQGYPAQSMPMYRRAYTRSPHGWRWHEGQWYHHLF